MFGGMAPHRGCEPDVPGPISGDLSRQPMTRLPRSMAVSRFRHGGADQRSMAIGACGRASASHSGGALGWVVQLLKRSTSGGELDSRDASEQKRAEHIVIRAK